MIREKGSRFVAAFLALLALQFGALQGLTALENSNPPAESQGASSVDWQQQWPKFRLAEGVGTGLMAVGLLAMQQQWMLAPAAEARWSSEILVDLPIRNGIGAKTANGEEFAAGISDIGLVSLMALPLVDAIGSAGFAHGNSETALQLSLIAMESMAASAFVTTAIKRLVGRERPLLSDCFADPGQQCDSGHSTATESFPSGHTSMAFTGAALICTSHKFMPLWGDGWANQLPCYASMAAAATTGALRIAGNRHHFSDVFVGAGIGLLAGGLLPWLLHFRGGSMGDQIDSPDSGGGDNWTFAPGAVGNGPGASMTFTW